MRNRLRAAIGAAAAAGALAAASAGTASAATTRTTTTRTQASSATSPAAPATSTDATPTITHLAGGAARYTFALPDGETTVETPPPAGFHPLTASAAQLAKYDFPARPSGGTALQQWHTAMADYKYSPTPARSLSVTITTTDMSVVASNWAGFSAGQRYTQSDAFVAVTADMTVPSAGGCASEDKPLGVWIGLGGTSGKNDLVQQGIICGTNLGTGWEPFHEFANTNYAVSMCASGLSINNGDTLYENMSYQTSSNTAYWYIEDLRTGQSDGCNTSAAGVIAKGWGFDGNTADYIVEPVPGEVPFSTVHVSNALLEWGSTGDWVRFGTRPTTKWYVPVGSGCAYPSTIGSDEDSFSVSNSC